MMEKLKHRNSGKKWDDGRFIQTLYKPKILKSEALLEWFTKKKKKKKEKEKKK